MRIADTEGQRPMTPMARSRIAAALLAAVALMAAAAPPAVASLKIHESSRSQLVTSQFASVTASCRKGEAPISGGYDIPNPITDGNFFLPFGSFLGETGWLVSARLAAGDLGENSLTSTVYCARLGKKMKTRGETTPIDAGTSTDLTAVCKPSETVVSGGWAIVTNSSGSGLVLESVRSGKRGWTVSGGMTSGTGTLVALADCAPSDKAPKLAARRQTSPIAAASTTSAPASCKRGEQVVAAGFKSDSAFVPYEFRRDTKHSWTNDGVAFGDAGDATTIVYCEKLG